MQVCNESPASGNVPCLALPLPVSKYRSRTMSAAQEASSFGLQGTVCRHPCRVLKRRLFPLLSPRFLFLQSSQAAAPIRVDSGLQRHHDTCCGQPQATGGQVAVLADSKLIITQACSKTDDAWGTTDELFCLYECFLLVSKLYTSSAAVPTP